MLNMLEDVSVQMLAIWVVLCCVPLLLLYIVQLHFSKKALKLKLKIRKEQLRKSEVELARTKRAVEKVSKLKCKRVTDNGQVERLSVELSRLQAQVGKLEQHIHESELLMNKARTSWMGDPLCHGDMVQDCNFLTSIQRRQTLIQENARRVNVTAQNFGLLVNHRFDLALPLGLYINMLIEFLQSKSIISTAIARKFTHEHLDPTTRVSAVMDFVIESSVDPQETLDILREFFCHKAIGFVNLWDQCLGTVDSETMPASMVQVTRPSWKHTVHTLILHNCPCLRELMQYIPEMKKNCFRNLDVSYSVIDARYGFVNPVQTLQGLANGLPQLECLDISGTNLAYDETEEDRADPNMSNNDGDIAGLRALRRPLKYLAIIDAANNAGLLDRLPCAGKIAHLDTPDRIRFAMQSFKDKTDRLRQLLAQLSYRYWTWSRLYTDDEHKDVLHAVVECMQYQANDEMVMEFGLGIVNIICQMVFMQSQIPLIKKNIDHGLTRFGAGNAIIRMHCGALLSILHYSSQFDAGGELRAVFVGLESMQSALLQRTLRALISIAQAKGQGQAMFMDNRGIQYVLSLIEQRLKFSQFDWVMYRAWQLMWTALATGGAILEENVTRQFVDSDGLQCAVKCLQTVTMCDPDYKNNIMHIVLGTIGNLQDEQIRLFFMTHQENIPVLIGALDVGNVVTVSSASANILIKLILDGPSAWTCASPEYNTIDQCICTSIQQWDVNKDIDVFYSSLNWVWYWIDYPNCCAARQYALWTLANLTKTSRRVYCVMLYNGGAVEKLLTIIEEEATDSFSKNMAQITVNNIKQWLSRHKSTELKPSP